MQAQAPIIRIAAYGVDSRTLNALRVFFKVQCDNRCELVEEQVADASIIDLDAPAGQAHWLRHRERFAERPALLLSARGSPNRQALVLRKPLKPAELLAALRQVREHFERQLAAKAPVPQAPPAEAVAAPGEPTLPAAQTFAAASALAGFNADLKIGTARDIDPDDPAQVARAAYRPEQFFSAVVRQALGLAARSNAWVEIAAAGGDIMVFPGGDRLQVRIANAISFRSLCSLPVIDGKATVAVHDGEYTPAQTDTYPVMDAEGLLWQTVLYASRGRVPVGTDLAAPVRLVSWPNMTRLALFPHAMRVAALWARRPCSLLGAAQALGIAQRYVFSFYSACLALDKIAVLPGSGAARAARQAPPGRQGNGILGRILTRLKQ